MKSNIDDLLAKLFDTLLISLRSSVVNQYNAIDGFASKSMDDLHHVPQTIEEMGEVNEKYQNIMNEKPKVISFYFDTGVEAHHWKINNQICNIFCF